METDVLSFRILSPTMRKHKKGFTIVELVIVIAVIGILSAILIPTFVNVTANAKTAALKSDLANAYSMYVAEAADGVNDETKTIFYVDLVGQKDILLEKDGKQYVFDTEWKEGSVSDKYGVAYTVSGETKTYSPAEFGGYTVLSKADTEITYVAQQPATSQAQEPTSSQA